MRKLLFTTAAAVALLAASGAAQATIIPGSAFAGFAGSGNSGADNYGNPWLWNTSANTGASAWGMPGLAQGTTLNYAGAVPATDFEISFLYTSSTTSIDQTPSTGAGGYNDMTRFDVCNPTCVEWTPVFISINQVNFIAPAGSQLNIGDNFFVNVLFTGGALDGSTAGFSAVYTFGDVIPTIPEPATIALLGVGLLGLGLVRRRA